MFPDQMDNLNPHTNEKAHQPKKASTKAASEFFTLEEKAQYEVFKNGDLPRETIAKWTKQDLSAIRAFVHIITSNENVMEALVNGLYNNYKKLHDTAKETEVTND